MSTVSATLYASLIILALGWLRALFGRPRDDMHRVPGPPKSIASWIWGHELLAHVHEPNHMYTTWVKAYGSAVRIKAALFHPDILLVTDHAAVHHVLGDVKDYIKSPGVVPHVASMLGKGLPWAEGAEHRFQRRILSPAFTPDSVKGMADAIFECAENIEHRLTGQVPHGPDGTVVDMTEYCSSVTLDVIGRVGFGHDFGASAGPVLSPSATDARAIFDAWKGHIQQSFTFLAFLGPLILRAFPKITSTYLFMPAQGKSKLLVKKLARRFVDAAEQGADVEKGKDILSILLRAGKDGQGKDAEKLTDEQILDNINTFTIVGHDTTASVLDFTFLELARHPEMQRKLREEILSSGQSLTYDTIQDFPYLDAVVKEGLRLHASVPAIERVALKDDIIPLHKPIRVTDGTPLEALHISKGQVLLFPVLTMQRNPAVWGADAALFRPERWLTPGGVPPPGELPHTWSGLMAFSEGPRTCIGYRLAVLEMKVILATLIRGLEFHDTGAQVREHMLPTLTALTDGRGGYLPLRVTLAGKD
ncbi:hypothetical protein PLICRDRAFT_179772 [Plicaturopsis crispa FD-325 SS-3]|uniref:Cytochrome P450 n=1 Tax=Plicaturopsis crispa FD-325 SS-3 TaxID=944288 RepID=A0A0C9SKP4_PLICR|nr:hypothetical protein PLICRDRAFT_179772 [Plicaturopsis crispa FD-325 SS-3]